jgi:DNA-3-methyladenine glycosylase II
MARRFDGSPVGFAQDDRGRATLDLDLADLGGQVERLVEVRGIGRWTAEMFLMFHLGRLDVLPVGDLGVQEGLRLLEGRERRPTPDEVAERAEPWRPLCSVASWYLWRLTEKKPARAATRR